MDTLSITFNMKEVSKGSHLLRECALKITLMPSNEFKLVRRWENCFEKQNVCFGLPHIDPDVMEDASMHRILFDFIHISTGDLVGYAEVERVQLQLNDPKDIEIHDQIEGTLGVLISFSKQALPAEGFDRFSPACLSAMAKIKRRLENRGIPGLEAVLKRFYDPAEQGCISRSELVEALSSHLDISLSQKLLEAFIVEVNGIGNPPHDFKEQLEHGGFLWYPGLDKVIVEPERIKVLKKKLRRLFQEAKERGLHPKRVFRHFDIGDKGEINKKDLLKGLRRLGFDLSIKEVIMLMGELTENETVSLSDLAVFADEADEYERPLSPLWSPTISYSRSEDEFKEDIDVPVVDDIEYDPGERLKVRTAELQNQLEQAKLRIRHLEEMCARSQKELMRARQLKGSVQQRNRSVLDESAKSLVQRAQDLLIKKFDHKRIKQDDCIEAHIAMELLLEKELEEVKAEKEVLQKKYLAEMRARARLRSQLDALFSATCAGEQAVVRSVLGQHLIRACRELCRSSYSLLSQYAKNGTLWVDSDKLDIHRSDLLSLQRLFHSLNWTESVATDSEGKISVLELLKGLEAFLSWEIQEQKLSKARLDETVESKSDWFVSPTFLKLKTLALCCRTDEDGPTSILSWFPEEAAGNQDYCIHYTDLNDCIFTATRVAFDNPHEIQQCLTYFNSKQWLSEEELQHFAEKKTLSVALFCNSLHSFALSEKPAVMPQVAVAEDTANISEDEKVEGKEETKLDLDVELEIFSSNEHSSCWAPLSRFGRPPFECVRLLYKNQTAEYNTTSSRSIMAFVEGEIMDTQRRVAVSMVKDKSVGRGSWALCVTSSPPMNRLVKGSCVYKSIAGDATSFAYVQGVNAAVTECTSRKAGLISDAEAKLAYREIGGNCIDIERVLTGLYNRFFRDTEVLREEIDAFMKSQRLSDSACAWSDFKNLLGKFEAELAVHANSILDHMRVQEGTVNNALRRGGVQGLKSKSDRSEFVSVVSETLDVFRGYLSHMEWEKVLRDAMVTATESSTAFNTFSMEGVVKGLIKALILRFNVERLKLAHGGGSSKLATKAVDVGDTLTAVVCNGTVQYLVNGALQAELRPTCARPWRFAWFATSSAAASVIKLTH